MKAWIATAFTTILFFGLGCTTIPATAQTANDDIASYLARAPFKMPEPIVPKFSDRTFSIVDYGGIADGKTLNTAAFDKTISACAAAGGGRVLVPTGTWLTGPIRLQSNVDLHLDKGALVQLTTDHTQYPMIKAGNKSTSIVPASPVYGYELKNIAITGEGIIDGAGDSWRPVKKGKTTPGQWSNLLASGGVVSKEGDLWWPSREAMDGEAYLKILKSKGTEATPDDYLPARDWLRPYMLYLVGCENILLEGITLRNSPKFVFYPNNCSNLTMRSVNVFNEWWAQNGDGIDISACKNVAIFKCTVSAGDDGICMKSSSGKKDDPGAANLENVLVAGCTVFRAHGGFVIGSNTDGGMRNIFVTDCHFIGTDVGIRVKSNAGRGGLVKDIYIDHISMRNIVHEAILFDTYYEDAQAGSSAQKHASDKIPEFTAFHISDIDCQGAKTAIAITGLPEMAIHDLYFDNIAITSDKGVTTTEAANLHFNKTKILASDNPVYLFNNTSGITISEGVFPANRKVFIRAEGKSGDITVKATDLRKPADAVSLGSGVSKTAVTVQ